MKMGNGYLDKLEANKQDMLIKMQAVMRQYMMDTLDITLHEDFGFAGYHQGQRAVLSLPGALPGGAAAGICQEAQISPGDLPSGLTEWIRHGSGAGSRLPW